MKITLLTGLASLALASGGLAQDPTATPAAPASPAPTAQVSSSLPPGATPSAGTKDDLESRIKKRTKGVHVTIDRDDHKGRDHDHDHDPDFDFDKDFEDLGALAAIPIVGIIFGTLSLFGAPVLVVGAIMFFSYLKQRSLHRTVRMMVEKGQEVPAALFAPPPIVRARSDMRRGVVLVMVGIGLMLFFAAVNDWEGGAWAIGLIPFLMGAGYLTVWRLEGNKPGMTAATLPNTSTDNIPRVP